MKYELNESGLIVAIDSNLENGIELNGSEPFTMTTAHLWKWDYELIKWMYIGVDYQYLIIPTDLIPMLSGSSVSVQQICVDKFFTMCLDNVSVNTIQQDGVSVPTLPVSFTPVSILEFTESDAIQLKGIIDTFNAMYDPPRRIDFNCHFANIQELEMFISQNSVL